MAEVEQADLHTGGVAITRDEIDQILARPVLARIATTGSDMQPHVVPVWFWWDGEHMYMETGVNFQKARNLRENPKCAVIVDDTQGGLRFWGIFMQGTVELITGPRDWIIETVTKIYRKHLGEEGIQAPTPQTMINSEHVIIKFTPDRIITWNETRHSITPIG
jgi:PPOX class probable F420-dependent enzyme